MAGRSKSSRFCRRKMRVKQLNTSFELLEVLKLLGSGNTATATARARGCSKSNITYWKNKLLDMGALRLQTVDVIKIYSLTPYGSKILARSDKASVEPVVLEDYAVKFVVVESERVRVDWVKLGSPRNWQQMGFTIGNVKVEKTSRHVIIHPGRLKGFDVDELEVTAGRIIERTRALLENRFGMVLSDDGVPLRKPIYRFYSEEAKEDVKHGTCIIDGKSSTDNSPPEHIPHEEYNGKERAKARQLLPDSVHRLEMKVDALTQITERLADSIGKLSDTLCKLVQPDVQERPESEVPSYVR